ncbi:GFA family protein [Thalassospira sp. UBA1131]|uniref:GFA family protein n=1 Tax=Thalassospira sp. UBA1131 TaxID=1947672 RepID=UPI0025FAC8ED|nr:GFA family protein [Thalassospira sp. UBA1131]
MSLTTQNQTQTRPIAGGCQCGAVRYELIKAPSQVYVCHCRECQKQSASAFGISAIVAPEDIRIAQGIIKTASRPTSGGGPMDYHFCDACGTRLFHGDLHGREPVSVKGGSLDVPPDLSTAMHIWVRRKLTGVIIPEGVQVFEEDPEF